MNKSAFLQLIQQVSGITDQQTDELEKVASAFPYCQTAHLLLAKSAYDKGSMLSSQRLRRASSYATDRQLLKEIIQSVPAPLVPVFEETLPEEEQKTELLPAPVVQQVASSEAVAMVTDATEIQPENKESGAESEDLKEQVETEQQETPQGVMPVPATPAATENNTEESLYSELAMLLNINSLSSSSTDLFTAKPDKTAVAPAPLPIELLETTETATEAEVEIADPTGADEPVETEATETEASAVDENTSEEAIAAVTNLLPAPEAGSAGEADAEQPFGEINYSSDEIDRLYAEDALGYWMGSSRMGEVLQLKDDYTRPKPQSFHPELILEYSKTHELEKAIQPDSNVLSQQLNIIDQFLKLNPRLKTMASLKLKPEPQEDLSLKSTRIKKGMASENLASIFLKQGKVKKAIKIYEQLLLKYPEKKPYFAEQIEKLQTIN